LDGLVAPFAETFAISGGTTGRRWCVLISYMCVGDMDVGAGVEQGAVKELRAMKTVKSKKSLPITLFSVQQQC